MLTDIKVRKAKPKAKVFTLTDQFGLKLEVRKTGKKFWRFRYSFNKQEKIISLGEYPGISLFEARAKRDNLRRDILSGIDPVAKKRKLKRNK